jgi:hypothetical protein
MIISIKTLKKTHRRFASSQPLVFVGSEFSLVASVATEEFLGCEKMSLSSYIKGKARKEGRRPNGRREVDESKASKPLN